VLVAAGFYGEAFGLSRTLIDIFINVSTSGKYSVDTMTASFIENC
jgi:hypothetical protein